MADMIEPIQGPNPNRTKYFKTLGADPALVPVDGIDSGGFYYLGRAPLNFPLVRIEDSELGWRCRLGWPAPFFYERYLQAARADEQLREAAPSDTLDTTTAKPTRGLRRLITHWLRS